MRSIRLGNGRGALLQKTIMITFDNPVLASKRLRVPSCVSKSGQRMETFWRGRTGSLLEGLIATMVKFVVTPARGRPG